MVPTRENRPSTANTMLLVLKPRPVDFSPSSNHFMGSENEREAWRKNRVMQMKLHTYLTEVQQQQQSSKRLLKTEEYRFLQEATRRSGVPRSVNMLDQLHFFRDKTFPGRRFSTDWHFRDGYPPHHHKHPPMSARPIRPQRQTAALLNRPKTSATLYRKNLDDNDEKDTNDQTNIPPAAQPNLNTKYQILIDSNGRHVASVSNQQTFDVVPGNKSLRDQDFRQINELPPIKVKDNKENIQPSENLKDNAINLPRDIQSSTFMKNESEREVRTAPQGMDRNNNNFQSSSVKTSEFTPPRQRRASSRLNSLTEPVPLDNFDKDLNNNLLPDQSDPFASSMTEEEIEKEIKNIRVNNFIEKHAVQVQEYQQQPIIKQSQQQLDNETLNLGVSAKLLETKLAEEIADETTLPDQEHQTEGETTLVKPQKRLIRQNTKTNFNRIAKNEPAPLRHNITSVLRQERTKFEASQKKVKDYLHTMGGSKDSSAKHSNAVSREPSAHGGRRSQLRKSTPNA